MPRKTEMKKAVVFIVEGKSDKAALEHIFKIIYKHKNVTFEFTNLFYSTTEISCRNTQKVVDRNKWKKEMMNQLVGLQDINGIPYRCFFMSSNLDHAL